MAALPPRAIYRLASSINKLAWLKTLTFAAGLLLIVSIVAPANAAPFVLYDVNFNSDPLGQPVPFVPAADATVFPRTHPTRSSDIPGTFEPPIVVASSGPLSDQPALFAPQVEDYSRLAFEIGGRLSNFDFDCIIAGGGAEECSTVDPQRDRYVIELDIHPIALARPFGSSGGFSILLDNPSTQRVDLTSDGIIGLHRSGGVPDLAIGSFTFGEVLSLRIEMDFLTDGLSVFKDNQLLVVDTWTALDLTGVRIGTQSIATDLRNEVAIDNLRILAIPEPTSSLLLFIGLACLTRRNGSWQIRDRVRGPSISDRL